MDRSIDCALLVVLLASAGAGCARSAQTAAQPPAPAVLESREGLASYYGQRFHGRLTASGAPFDMNTLVAAHPTYPFGTVLRVTNLAALTSVNVEVVDRGPATAPRKEGVIIDLSRAAAQALGFLEQGRTRVRLEVLRWGDDPQ